MPSHSLIGILAMVVPTLMILFALFALGKISFGKPPAPDPAPKKKTAPHVRPMPRPAAPKTPEPDKKEQRRARRRAKRDL
jgi:hypothetical protein